MKKWLVSAVLLCSLLAAGYAALPWYSAHQLVQAARSEDMQQLQEYVDFPALRANLKARLKRGLQESMGESVPPELSGILAAGTDLFIGPLVDQLITPEGIGDLLQGRRDLQELERQLYIEHSAQPDSAPSTAPIPPQDGDDGIVEKKGTAKKWHLQGWRFTGFNQVTVDCGENSTPQLRLFLQRQGLRWKLVDIQLL